MKLLLKLLLVILLITNLQPAKSQVVVLPVNKINLEKTVNTLIEYDKSLVTDEHYQLLFDSVWDYLQDYKNKYGYDETYLIRSPFLISEYSKKEVKAAIEMFEKNIIESEKINCNKAYSINNQNLGSIYFDNQFINKAVDYYLKSTNIFKEEEDWPGYAYGLIDIGNIYYYQELNDIAYSYFTKAENVFSKKVNDNGHRYTGLAIIENNYGLIHQQLDEMNDAIKHFRKGLKYRKLSNNKNTISGSYIYLAYAYMNIDVTDSASYYLTKSITTDSINNDYQHLITSYILTGKYEFLKNKNSTKAMVYFNKSIDLAKKSNYFSGIAGTYYSMATISISNSDTTAAIKYYSLSDSISESMNNMHFAIKAKHKLADLYKQTKKYKKQSFYLESIVSHEFSKFKNDAYESEIKFQMEERENEENLRKKEGKINAIIIWGESVIVILLLAIVFLSIYARKKLSKKSKELEETLASQDLIYSIISHDLRGPLGNFEPMISMILEDDVDDDTRDRLMELLKQSAGETYTLLENLLQWANHQRGVIIVDPIKLNVKQALDIDIKIFCKMAMQKNIEIKNNSSSNYWVLADEHMFHAIFRNLINNAIKFTNSNGNIELSTEVTDRELIISVKDNGVGINPDKQSTIFGELKVIPSQGTNQENGFGIGLQIVASFVKDNKGRIWLESEEGSGSTFYIALPLTEAL